MSEKDSNAYVILELLDRIVALEKQIIFLKNVKGRVLKKTKYQPLTDYILDSQKDSLTLSFNDIEKILGFPLPASARRNRSDWTNTMTKTMPLSWLSIGYRSKNLDMENEFITFEKERSINETESE